MLKPDKYFEQNKHYFPSYKRIAARKLFRRAVREYYVMQRKYVAEPLTNKRVQSVFIGEEIKQQKSQNRRVKKVFTGRISAGRPHRPEIKLLVARLFILWQRYSNLPATFSWKSDSSVQTYFEQFMFDLFPRIRASDVRRYVETHWRERK
ncbi:MAG: hypothetical protein WCG12_12925 [Alcaligenaceae bacterium]